MYISYFIWLLPKKSPSRWIFMCLLLDKKIETRRRSDVQALRGKKKVKVKVTQSYLTLCNPVNCIVHEILQARIEEWLAFPFSRGSSQPRDQTQVTCIAGWILYQLSHKGSPRILAWVAYSFSRGSSWLKNWTRVSCMADGVFAAWAIREAQQFSHNLGLKSQ